MARIITNPGYLRGLDEVRGMSAGGIASLSEVADPDNAFSAGAEFVKALRDDLLNTLDYQDDPVEWLTDGRERADDYAATRGDQMVGEIVRTHERWETFVDLCAYDTDYGDYLGEGWTSLDDLRDIALSVTATQVMRALLKHIRYHIRENEDDDPGLGFRIESENGVLSAVCPDCENVVLAADLDLLFPLLAEHSREHQ